MSRSRKPDGRGAKRRRGALRMLLRTALAGAAAGVLACLLVVGDGLLDEVHAADVAVVLGNTVKADGAPSPRLKARLDKAAELYRRGLFPHVVVSGGVGKEGHDEAVVMKRYLAGRGVPAERIHVDGAGVTTRATARNLRRLMRENGWRSALVVTQYFHVPRSRLAIRQCGVSPVYSAHAAFWELRDVYSTLREVIGYAAYLSGARGGCA